MKYLLTSAVVFTSLAISGEAYAQNTGGVFGPVVNEGHKAAQYRATFDPGTDGLSQRVHYEQSANGDIMLRAIVQVRKSVASDVDFDFLQGELFWDLSEDGDAWRTGMRFDGRIRSDGRPGMIGVNWMNQWALGEGWQGRFVVLTSADVGDDARDGVFLGTRALLSYAGFSNTTLSTELYSSYGRIDEMSQLEDQVHQLGPALSAPLTQDWSVYSNILLGLTDASPDSELRLRLTRAF